jgi:hypothetical protein
MAGVECLDPRQFDGCGELSQELVDVLRRVLAPQRCDRFQSAQALLDGLNAITNPKFQENSEATNSDEQSEVGEEVKQETSTSTSTQEAELPITPDPSAQPIELIPTAGVPIEPFLSLEAQASPFKSIPFNLFDLLPEAYQASPDPSKPIVLDPSEAYRPSSGYIIIDNEIDWMRRFDVNGSPYWIKGKTLCDWAEEWLRCWHRNHLIAEIKQPPRDSLATLLEPIPVPSDWTEAQCLAVVSRLETYPSRDPIAYLLADLTESDPQLWIAPPTIEHLAQWLTIQVPEPARPLEQAWQAKRPHSFLSQYYQTTDKLQLLRQWLGIIEPKPLDLGPYPFEVPPMLQAEFDHYWDLELYRSKGSILDNLDLTNRSDSRRIAARAYEMLKQNPDYISPVREKQLKGYIDHDQYQDLTQRQKPPEPQPLPLEASPKEALRWVTEAYLPLRRWETVVAADLPKEKHICNRLASSFETWMLEHYPELTVDSVPSSWLNYSVCHHVQELCTQGPVFWIVVDGLGWLDHQELLAMLTENQKLKLEQGQTPRFSILPTKTEYAKWSLYSQRLPGHGSWKNQAVEGFRGNDYLTQNGQRYSDHDETKGRLQKAIKAGKLKLYCWDTDRFDSLFHNEVDWQNLYTFKRKRVLRDIADDIVRFIDLHPQKDTLRIVIASDHGQLMGIAEKLVNIPEGLETKGRMAIGIADHSHLVALDRARFNLPHDISIVKGPKSFSAFKIGDDKSITGCHGGLYPEEVVVGFSVLKRSVKRAPVIIKCSGTGRSGESGQIAVEIYNPNSLAIEDLKITIDQLVAFQAGQPLPETLEPKTTQTIQLAIPTWPELPPSHVGKYLPLTGKLQFRYRHAELTSVDLDPDSAIEVSQIFSSGIEGLDDFL